MGVLSPKFHGPLIPIEPTLDLDVLEGSALYSIVVQYMQKSDQNFQRLKFIK
jgi:hypothetical protein